MGKYWKYIQFGSFVLKWIATASADGVIDRNELAQVIEQALKVFAKDIKVRVK